MDKAKMITCEGKGFFEKIPSLGSAPNNCL